MISRKLIAGLFTFSCLLFAACDGGGNNEPAQIIDGPPARSVSDSDYIETASGLKYFDFADGTGPAAAPGDTLFVNYTGWLTDGFIFDSSVFQQGRTPIRIILGETSVIEGWTEGLEGIREGGDRQLLIPPALGYGAFGRSPWIPPNATLIFEVQIASLRDATP